jgi:hypothetical protein
MRILRDNDGVEWQVWRVPPDPRGHLERRRADRRRGPDPNYRGEERRQQPDRRGGGSLQDGWLVFQSDREKRRLMPAPEDWEQCDEQRLGLMLRVARPARTPTIL